MNKGYFETNPPAEQWKYFGNNMSAITSPFLAEINFDITGQQTFPSERATLLLFPFWGDCPLKASAAHIRSDLESKRRQESQRLLETGLGGGRMEGTESGEVAIS